MSTLTTLYKAYAFMNYTVPLQVSEISRGLQDMKLTKVADRTGFSYSTIRSLHDGEDRNFGIEVLLAVSNYLRDHNVREGIVEKSGAFPPRLV